LKSGSLLVMHVVQLLNLQGSTKMEPAESAGSETI
jgi:hypothetical protein